MNAAALQQLQAARQALDEQAVKTACLILDGLLRDHAPDSPRKPPQPRRVEAMQTDLLEPVTTRLHWECMVSAWIRCQRIGLVFSHKSLCDWIEHDSGAVLTSADLDVMTNGRVRWRRMVSNVLNTLHARNVLARTDVNGKDLPTRSYRIVHLH